MTDDSLKQIIAHLRNGCSLPQAFDYHMVVDRGMAPRNVLLLRDSCSEPRSIRASVENAAEELGTYDELEWTDTDDAADETPDDDVNTSTSLDQITTGTGDVGTTAHPGGQQ